MTQRQLGPYTTGGGQLLVMHGEGIGFNLVGYPGANWFGQGSHGSEGLPVEGDVGPMVLPRAIGQEPLFNDI